MSRAAADPVAAPALGLEDARLLALEERALEARARRAGLVEEAVLLVRVELVVGGLEDGHSLSP